MGETYDYLFKLIVIGDAAVGKSCILHRFTQNKVLFRRRPRHTGDKLVLWSRVLFPP